MSVNIEMNYYDGSSYTVLTPMANFQNMSGNLSVNQIPDLSANKITSGNLNIERMPSSGIPKTQIVKYRGTGTNVSIVLNYNNPYFITGCSNGRLHLGFLSGGGGDMMVFYNDNWQLRIGMYFARVSGKSIYFTTSGALQNATWKLLFSNTNVNVTCTQQETILYEYGRSDSSYTFLVLY